MIWFITALFLDRNAKTAAEHTAFKWRDTVASSLSNSFIHWCSWLLSHWNKAKAWPEHRGILMQKRGGTRMCWNDTSCQMMSVSFHLISRNEAELGNCYTLVCISAHSFGLGWKRRAEICLNVFYSVWLAKSLINFTCRLSFDGLSYILRRAPRRCSTPLRCLLVRCLNFFWDIEWTFELKLTHV